MPNSWPAPGSGRRRVVVDRDRDGGQCAAARRRRLAALVMGVLEPGLVTLVVSLGLTMTSPVNGSVFWSLTPLLMPVLGYLVLGERLEIAVLAAAALAFAATMLLVWGQNQHGGGNWIGDVCVAGGVLASAANALLARRTAQAGANPLVTSCWQLTSACHGGGAAGWCCCRRRACTWSRPACRRSGAPYLGLVVSGGVYILSNYALRHMPVGRMGLFSCLVGPSVRPCQRCSSAPRSAPSTSWRWPWCWSPCCCQR